MDGRNTDPDLCSYAIVWQNTEDWIVQLLHTVPVPPHTSTHQLKPTHQNVSSSARYDIYSVPASSVNAMIIQLTMPLNYNIMREEDTAVHPDALSW